MSPQQSCSSIFIPPLIIYIYINLSKRTNKKIISLFSPRLESPINQIYQALGKQIWNWGNNIINQLLVFSIKVKLIKQMQITSPAKNLAPLYVPENRLGYPERRKMYRLNDRHSLNSRIDITWINSLQENQLKRSKIDEKKHEGYDKIIQNYNKYVDRELNERYQMLPPGSISHNDRIESSRKSMNINNEMDLQNNNNKLSNSQVLNNESLRYDKTLNAEIQSFRGKGENRKNSSYSVEYQTTSPKPDRRKNYERNNFRQQAESLNPHFLKQMLLRSALDRPEFYSKINEHSTIRNIKPDNLQTYLRVGQKKTTL